MADKEIVSTDRAPTAIGPYSQAIRSGGLLFISGQIPIDPATGDVVAGTIEDQTRQVMENLKAILGAAGLGMERVVKTTIFLTDLDAFASVNAIYGRYFPANPPARATVEVSRLPKGVAVEIEAIATVK